jgi:putative endonuclease
MATVYILQSIKDGRFYVGITVSMENRPNRHNRGLVRSTKAFVPWKVVFQKEYNDMQDASRTEKFIKRQKSRRYIEELVRQERFL